MRDIFYMNSTLYSNCSIKPNILLLLFHLRKLCSLMARILKYLVASWFLQPVDAVLGRVWLVLEPLLFGLIGAEVDLHKIKPATMGKL